MRPTPRAATVVILLAVGLSGVACGSSDPRTRVLEQRARWDVQALGWVLNPDGSINLSTRLTGPPNSKIDQLTVAVELLGAGEAVVGRVWHTFDLAQVPRGGPKDIVIRIEPPGAEVENLGLVRVLQPTPEEEPHIAELQAL